MGETIVMSEKAWGGVDLFNRREYFKAFQAFEEFWRTSTGETRSYYQGLLNLSAAMLKITADGNQEGAVGLLEFALKLFGQVNPENTEIDLARLVDESAYLLGQVKAYNPAALAMYDRELLPLVHRKG